MFPIPCLILTLAIPHVFAHTIFPVPWHLTANFSLAPQDLTITGAFPYKLLGMCIRQKLLTCPCAFVQEICADPRAARRVMVGV